MAGKSTLRKSSHRTRTAVVGAVLAAGETLPVEPGSAGPSDLP